MVFVKATCAMVGQLQSLWHTCCLILIYKPQFIINVLNFIAVKLFALHVLYYIFKVCLKQFSSQIVLFLIAMCLICTILCGVWEWTTGRYFTMYLPWDSVVPNREAKGISYPLKIVSPRFCPDRSNLLSYVFFLRYSAKHGSTNFPLRQV